MSTSSTSGTSDDDSDDVVQLSDLSYRVETRTDGEGRMYHVAPPHCNETQRGMALRHYDIAETANDTAFANIVTLVKRATSFPHVAIKFVDATRVLQVPAPEGDASESRELSFSTFVILEKKPLIVRDTSRDERFRHHPRLSAFASLYGVPLITRDDMPIGALVLMSETKRGLSSSDLWSLQVFADIIMERLEHRRQTHEMTRALRYREKLHNELKRESLSSPLLRRVVSRTADGGSTPAESIIATLKELQARYGFAEDDRVNVDHAVEVIANDALYKVDLLKKFSDVSDDELPDLETIQFLEGQLANVNAGDALAISLAPRRPPPASERPPAVLRVPYNLDAPEIAQALENLESWEYDSFHLSAATKGRPLFYCAMAMLKSRLQLVEKLRLDETRLANFLEAIERGYSSSNLYHNPIHAADVIQTTYHFLEGMGGSEYVKMTPLEMLAVLIAAAVHDYKHPGVNNNFLMVTRNKVATVYNDNAVLENYHCAEAFELLYAEENNFVADLSDEEFGLFRKIIIGCVQATDLAQHTGLLGVYKNKIGQHFNEADPADRLLFFKMILKCADISNVAKPMPLYQPWYVRIMGEFYSQGDKERALGLPISPLMDRNDPQLAKCQQGFINFIVAPLYRLMDQAMVGANPKWVSHVPVMDANVEHWRAELARESVEATMSKWAALAATGVTDTAAIPSSALRASPTPQAAAGAKAPPSPPSLRSSADAATVNAKAVPPAGS